MKKTGFTLAEVLITLMILGVIAAMTVPTLIQDTQKKEQVVQMKKGLSMVNQAVTMNYALEQENLGDLAEVGDVIDLMKKRLSVVDSGTAWATTSDGLTYVWSANLEPADTCTGSDINNEDGTCATYELVIATAPINGQAVKDASNKDVTITRDNLTFEMAKQLVPTSTSTNVLTGFYNFYAGEDRVIPSFATQAIMNAKDLKKLKASDLAKSST